MAMQLQKTTANYTKNAMRYWIINIGLTKFYKSRYRLLTERSFTAYMHWHSDFAWAAFRNQAG